jgi:hypothetical protein
MRSYHLRSIKHFSIPILTLLIFFPVLIPAQVAAQATAQATAQLAPIDLSAIRPGPVSVERRENAVLIHWPDERARQWTAEFSLDPSRPLVTPIGVAGQKVI